MTSSKESSSFPRIYIKISGAYFDPIRFNKEIGFIGEIRQYKTSSFTLENGNATKHFLSIKNIINEIKPVGDCYEEIINKYKNIIEISINTYGALVELSFYCPRRYLHKMGALYFSASQLGLITKYNFELDIDIGQ